MTGSIQIRPYQPADREIVRRLCADTGFLGNPIDPVFEDREIFADFLTAYYTDVEPESSFVLQMHGEVKGYLLGCRKSEENKRFESQMVLRVLPVVLWRYLRYRPSSRAFIRWIVTNGRKETPASPPDTPHFHINLRPEARKVSTTRQLFDAFFKYLFDAGETSVYAQMVSIGNRRERVFERFGFHLLNRSEITKYRKIHSEPVFLSTIVKDLTKNDQLYERKVMPGESLGL